MDRHDINSIASFLSGYFSQAKRPTLFGGAGISFAAGLPVWDKYLSMLAESVRSYDPLTRQMMAERIREGELTNAAELFFICPRLTTQVKFEALASPLGDYDIEPVKVLCKLPFHAWVTTNYDRVLLDSYANVRGKAALEANYPEKSLTSAIFSNNPYIARLNGHVEDPSSMVLSDSQFESLKNDPAYLDFLVAAFSRSQLLFVGFSFADPAISSALQIVEERFPVIHQGRHYALLPENVQKQLSGKLERIGVTPIYYSPENQHSDLWSAFELFLGQGEIEILEKSSLVGPFDQTRKFLAASYARLRLGRQLAPLRQVVIQGLVANLLRESAGQGCLEKDLVERCQESVHLRNSDLVRWVQSAVADLEKERLCESHPNPEGNPLYTWIGPEGDPLAEAMQVLALGSLDRLFVRQGIALSHDVELQLPKFFEQVFVKRGWDLGAALASKTQVPDIDIAREMAEFGGFEKLTRTELVALERSILDLIRRPNRAEASVLADVGRLSFTVELAIGRPNSTYSIGYTLPQRLYLDANVLLPAITYGHPFNNVYESTIARLIESSKSIDSGVEIFAIQPFLNEVVSHRRLAIREMKEIGGHQARAVLQKEIWLIGARNLNVYVASYANLLKSQPDCSFEEYLNLHAPYNDERQLEKWLRNRGITVMHEGELRDSSVQLPEILQGLERAYSKFDKWRNKTAELIHHDAQQLACVEGDRRMGRRSVFVSVDMQLRSKLEQEGFGHLVDHMLSSAEFVQLVDLLLGSSVDKQGLSELIWAAPVTSRSERVRDYFIDLGLNEYDQAVAKKLPNLVEDISEDAVFALEAEFDEHRMDSTLSGLELVKFMEPFEDEFFKSMRKAMEAGGES